jgi:hypothetical protein
MAESKDTPTHSHLPTHHQDWGTIVTAGLLLLAIAVVAVNLIVFDIPPDLEEQLPIPTVWLQTGRWAGLVVSLAGGGALLWCVLRR